MELAIAAPFIVNHHRESENMKYSCAPNCAHATFSTHGDGASRGYNNSDSEEWFR